VGGYVVSEGKRGKARWISDLSSHPMMIDNLGVRF